MTLDKNHWRHKSKECAAARLVDKTNYENAQKAAGIKNQQDVLAAETHWKGVADDAKQDYDKKLSAAYASVARYADGVRSKAATRPTSSGTVPQATSTAEGVDGPGEGSSIPVSTGDLNVCAENTVKAQEWQDWWKGVVANWPK